MTEDNEGDAKLDGVLAKRLVSEITGEFRVLVIPARLPLG